MNAFIEEMTSLNYIYFQILLTKINKSVYLHQIKAIYQLIKYPRQQKQLSQMKISRQRNPYLHKFFNSEPHKYSFDLSRGKYTIINSLGKEYDVNSNGVFKQIFRKDYTGCVNHRVRDRNVKEYPQGGYFVPISNGVGGGVRSVKMKKFVGYTQFPYSIQQTPAYLKEKQIKNVSQRPRRSVTLNSEQNRTERIRICGSGQRQDFNLQKGELYLRAMGAMTGSRIQKIEKKTCYNIKCKLLKKMAIKDLIQLKQCVNSNGNAQQKIRQVVQGKSFHQATLRREAQQIRRLLGESQQ